MTEDTCELYVRVRELVTFSHRLFCTFNEDKILKFFFPLQIWFIGLCYYNWFDYIFALTLVFLFKICRIIPECLWAAEITKLFCLNVLTYIRKSKLSLSDRSLFTFPSPPPLLLYTNTSNISNIRWTPISHQCSLIKGNSCFYNSHENENLVRCATELPVL